MDLVSVPVSELGYSVQTLEEGITPRHPTPSLISKLSDLVGQSELVYGGGNLTTSLARKANVPAVGVFEYNLRTMIVFATVGVTSALKRAHATARVANYYAREVLPTVRGATLLHCNGYPFYREAQWLNRNRLLYLDSRMRSEMVIGQEQFDARLSERRTRLPRLIFSGRFEAAKGALDTILVAKECLARGLRFTLDLYGQGSQKSAMLEAVSSAQLGEYVRIHDPVSYPELVEITRGSDLFICCHVQDDPSCTYLETMGCGVPIAGYANAMWAAMLDDSAAGVCASTHDSAALAQQVARVCGDHDLLDALSRRALRFAKAHTFEEEFGLRTDSLREIMSSKGRVKAAG
jgi:glycosyltransferase involved in cell wall biosynthesis